MELEGLSRFPASRGSQRHLGKRGTRHHGGAVDAMVGEHRDQRDVEMPQPFRRAGTHLRAQQRMPGYLQAGGIGALRRIGQPPAPALPGIGWQFHGARGRCTQNTIHIGRCPAGDSGRQDAQHRINIGCVLAAEPLDGRERGAREPQALGQIALQDRARPDLHEHTRAFVPGAHNGIGESNGPAHIAPPVAPLERRSVKAPAGHGRNEGNLRPLRVEVRERPAQRPLGLADQSAMERIIEIEHAARHIAFTEQRRQPFNSLPGA